MAPPSGEVEAVQVSHALGGLQPRCQARADGPACVLGMGMANPPTEILQEGYPDRFFDITNSSDKLALKAKFKRICDKSGIRKRHMYLNEEVLKENPLITTYKEPSLNVRHDITIVQVPKLAAEAATNAIKEWGGRKADITHIVFATTSGVNMPGADLAIAKLLGLKPTVRRVMMYQTGCFGGATALRVAKDLAENNKGARVLAVCAEVTAVTYRAPDEEHLDGLIGSALFGDGAAVYVVGSDPKPLVEIPLFEVLWAGETFLPGTQEAIDGKLTEAGLFLKASIEVPGLISSNIGAFLNEVRKVIGSPDYNEMFWAVHPGGPAILTKIEEKLGLNKDKMQGSREVLSEFGNMSCASIMFVLDQIRKRSVKMGASTLGEGNEYGWFIGFGPGLTLEVIILRAAANA
jgi:chalcone synthase